MSKLSEKLKAVAAAIGAIEKQFGKGAVMRLGEGAEPQKVEVFPTGSWASTSRSAAAGIRAGASLRSTAPRARARPR